MFNRFKKAMSLLLASCLLLNFSFVAIPTQKAEASGSFTMNKYTAQPGNTITLSYPGGDFGTQGEVLFVNNATYQSSPLTVNSWSAESITVTVPQNCPHMTGRVETVNGADNTYTFGEDLTVYGQGEAFVSGRLLDFKGFPVPSEVSANENGGDWTYFYTTVRPDGYYNIGPFDIDSSISIYGRPLNLGLGRSIPVDMTLSSAGQNLMDDIVLNPPTIKGNLYDLDGTTKIQSASLYISKQDGGSGYANSLSDVNGDFEIGNVPDGTYKLTISSGQVDIGQGEMADPLGVAPSGILITLATSGGVQSITSISGAAEQDENGYVNISYLPVQVTGQLVDNLGNPVPWAGINLRNANYTYYADTQTDDNGEFRYGGLTVGATYRLDVYYAGQNAQGLVPPNTVSFTYTEPMHFATPDSLVLLRMSLPQVKGKVVDKDGNLLNYSTVYLSNNNGLQKSATYDDDNNFLFGGLNDGTYKVTVQPPYGSGLLAPSPVMVDIADGVVTETHPDVVQVDGSLLIQVLPPTHFITGTVKYPNGNPVKNANIFANKANGYTNTSASTNASGAFSLPVDSGNWFYSVSPSYLVPSSQIDWVYRNVMNSQTVEVGEQDGNYPQGGLNLVVTSSNATVTGKVYVGATGTTAPGMLTVTTSIYERYGLGYTAWTPIGPDGSFSMKVPAGSYQFGIYSQVYNVPDERTINLVAGANNIGITRIYEKTEFITGKVADSEGQGKLGMSVYAYREGGSGWANAITDSGGNYSLGVTPGDWSIQVNPDSQANLYYLGSPVRQTVISGQTVTGVNFTVQRATGHVIGRMIDGLGSLVTEIGAGYASATSEGFSQGAPIADGLFTIDLVPGGYEFAFSFPPGSPYYINNVNWVVIDGDQTVNFMVAKSDATIKGTLKDSSGNVITGINGGVNITDKNGKNLWANFDSATGTYEIPIMAGADWFVTVWVPSNSKASNGKYYTYDGGRITVSGITIGENTQDIVLSEANSIIKGRVTKSNGTALPYAQVYVNEYSSSSAYTSDNYAITDANGLYSLRLPAGTYTIGVGQTNEMEAAGEMIPVKARLTVTEVNSPLIHNFQFIKSNAAISGTVTLNGNGVRSYVWGWSEKGRSASTYSSANGSYVLNITNNDSWYVGASMESYDQQGDRISYRSDPMVIPIEVGALDPDPQTIILNPVSSSLTNEVSVTFSPAEPKTVVLDDGTKIEFPAGSIGGLGDVTLVATPKVEYPHSGNLKPLDLAYDLALYDFAGKLVKNFNTDISITFPYTDEQLAAIGITEDQLVVSYWDEATNSWKISPNFTVDTGQNKITVLTNHFSQWTIGANVMMTTVDVGADKTGYANIPLKLSPAVTDDGSGIVSYSWQAIDLDAGPPIPPQSLTVKSFSDKVKAAFVPYPDCMTFSNPVAKDTTLAVNRAGHFAVALIVTDGNSNQAIDIFELDVKSTPERLPVSNIKPVLAYMSPTGGWSSANTKFTVTGDFNGDGRSDVAAMYDYGANTMGIWSFESNGTSLTPKKMYSGTSGGWDVAATKFVTAGDFNGDGKDDIAAMYDYGANTMGIWVFESNGKTMVPKKYYTGTNGGWNTAATKFMAAGDFNKDGKDDVAAMYDYGANTMGIWNFESNGLKLTPKKFYNGTKGGWDTAATKFMVAGDFNNDGKTDVGALYDYGFGKIGVWSFESNGYALVPKKIYTNQYGGWDLAATKYVFAGDFNKDGKVDVGAMYDYGNGKIGIWSFQSNGLTLAPKALFMGAYGNWNADATKFMNAGDFNRDGRTEISAMYDYGSSKTGIWKFQ